MMVWPVCEVLVGGDGGVVLGEGHHAELESGGGGVEAGEDEAAGPDVGHRGGKEGGDLPRGARRGRSSRNRIRSWRNMLAGRVRNWSNARRQESPGDACAHMDLVGWVQDADWLSLALRYFNCK